MPMPETPLNSPDTEGIAKVILMLFGAGGFLKITVALVNKIFERYLKKDEHLNLSRERFEAVAWDSFKREEAITETLRQRISDLERQLFNADKAYLKLSLELDRMREEFLELKEENALNRSVIAKLNREHQIERKTQDDS
jgi:predicted RNase H-like nuclease (RuvC/YqgF family)